MRQQHKKWRSLPLSREKYIDQVIIQKCVRGLLKYKYKAKNYIRLNIKTI